MLSLGDLGTLTSLSEIFSTIKIVDKYKEEKNHDNPVAMQQDLLVLSALQTRLGVLTGFLVGVSQAAEDNMKLARAKATIKVREKKKELEDAGEEVKVTEKDVESLARLASSNILQSYGRELAVAKIAECTYYSIKDFISVLDKAVSRLRDDLRPPKNI